MGYLTEYARDTWGVFQEARSSHRCADKVVTFRTLITTCLVLFVYMSVVILLDKVSVFNSRKWGPNVSLTAH